MEVRLVRALLSVANREGIVPFARDLLAAGVTLLQYRNKSGSSRQMLSQARELRRLAGNRARLRSGA